MVYQNDWFPGKDVTLHTGEAIPQERDFFAAPPPEIGAIISADTSLTRAKQPLPIVQRLGISAILGSIVGLGIMLAGQLGEFDPTFWMLLFGLGFAAPIYFFFTKFEHTCSYVGTSGIARYRLKGNRTNKPTLEMLCFRDAMNLITKSTRNYFNYIYAGTSYSFIWSKSTGRPYQVQGRYHDEKGWPERHHEWHFLRAAEQIWSNYKLESANLELKQKGYVEFPMSGNPQAVRIGSGFMEFVERSGNAQRVEVADMKDIRLASGVFQFSHKDARWWSGRGRYVFNYANIPNAQLFLICLDSLAGIRWE
jgi:hypothetical protein